MHELVEVVGQVIGLILFGVGAGVALCAVVGGDLGVGVGVMLAGAIIGGVLSALDVWRN